MASRAHGPPAGEPRSPEWTVALGVSGVLQQHRPNPDFCSLSPVTWLAPKCYTWNLNCGFEVITVPPQEGTHPLFPGFSCTLGFQLSLPSHHTGFTSLGLNSLVSEIGIYLPRCVREMLKRVKLTRASPWHCSCISEHLTNKKHCDEVFLSFHNSLLSRFWLTSESENFLKNTNAQGPTLSLPN